MTNEQILKKAIEKAEKNGWKPNIMRGDIDDYVRYMLRGNKYLSILFDHEFAKAFWGEEHDWEKFTDANSRMYCRNCKQDILEGQSALDCWQYHLQRLALETDRLAYIKEFL